MHAAAVCARYAPSFSSSLLALASLAHLETLHRTRRLLLCELLLPLACVRASECKRPASWRRRCRRSPPPPSALAAASSVTIASRESQPAPRLPLLHAAPPPPAASSSAPLDAGVSLVTRLVLLATTFVLRLLRATLEAAKRLLLRCFRPLADEDAAAADAHTKRSAATARGLSVMREAEPTDVATATAAPLVVRSTSSSVETVTIGLLESSVASPPASPSSPSHSSSASVSTSMSLSSAEDAALDKREDPTDAITSPLLVGKGRRIKPFPPLDDDSSGASHSEAKHTRSLTSQQDLDQRRNSFSAMTADSRAQLRRRSHDFTDYASFTLPPPGSSAGFLHARSKNHVHMRVYGKADTVPLKHITARQEEGAALVDVVCPAARTIWRRGQPVSIEWKVLDADVQDVQIELMEEGSSATTTITKSTPNNGSFMYPKVPWGMQSGPTYFLRISSSADPSRYMTTVFFTIGSAP